MDYALAHHFPYASPDHAGQHRHDRKLVIAVVLSLLIHGIGLGWFPGIKSALNEVSQRLDIRLLAPPPKAEAEMMPVARTIAPTPRPLRHADSPAPRQTLPVMTSTLDAARDDTPSVSAVPAPVAAASEPVAARAPSAAPAPRVDADALAAYGRELAGAVAAHQRYPRVALLRQWQGSVLLQLDFAADGKLSATRVVRSSGYEVLDKQALDMVHATEPRLPTALAGRALTVDVPVLFRITS